MYASKLLTERSPVVKRVMVAETNTDAPKSFCDAPGGTGHRDMARSESSARELGRSAAAKAGAEVGWNRSSVEAGNGRGAKGSCIGSASNRSAGADSLRKKRMTEEEIATIAAKHRMAKFPNLALTRERLSRKVLLPVETVVERVNRLLKGWGAFYSVGYPSRAFRKVNHHVLKRMARFLNRKSQRRCRLKFADTYYGEMTHYGLCRLAWADVRRART